MAITVQGSTTAERTDGNSAAAATLLGDYEMGAAYDEMLAADGRPRPHYGPLHGRLRATSADDFRRRKAMTDLSMRQDGVGFTVYRAEEGIERVWPMDPVPRIIPAAEWRRIEEGLVQRLTALNLFLWDVYHEQHILRDGVVPPRLVLQGA
ncbi:MAG: circularly permuted type 2 ATP-grasp protein, partial [Planctomycetia bacterium]